MKKQTSSFNSNGTNILALKIDEASTTHPVAIVESMKDSIIRKSLKGTITVLNKGNEKIFGYKANDEISQTIFTEEENIIEEIRKSEIIEPIETLRIKKNSEKLNISLTISAQDEFLNIIKEPSLQHDEKEKRSPELIIANNELVFQNEEKEKLAAELIIATNHLKLAEEHNYELEKELESFTYSASHDLRAPLRVINGYTYMLKEKLQNQLDPEANRLINIITRNANKMGRLIDGLLTISRIRRKMVKDNISMHSLVTGVCNELKEDLPNRNIKFCIDNLLPGLGDHTAIKEVWLNLVSNAIKYSRLKETVIIEIGSKAEGKYVTYSIKDNGAGFDMRYANKLFGVFQRLHSEEEFEGTGVGLALVHRIIAKHGGRTWAESTVNEGSTFHFTLNKP